MTPKYRKMTFLSVLLLIVLIFVATVSSGTSYANQAEAASIRLKAGQFTPSLGESLQIRPGLAISQYAQGQRGYYLVQFAGPVQESWKAEVTAVGAELLNYVPDFAFKVRMTPVEAAQVEALNNVAWVGIYQPAYKLDPTLKREGTNLYRVRIENGVSTGEVMAAIARSGAQILTNANNILLVAADSAQLDAVANVLDVAWIENFVFKEKHNDSGAGVIIGGNIANGLGYDGSTQTVAVADTGLGGGTAATAHPDIPAGRVTAVYNWPGASAKGCYTVIGDGAIDVDSGHGTHVSVSVLGDGGVGGIGKGTAPAAHLVFQATEDYADMGGQCALVYPDGYYLLGLPDDLHALFQQAYNAGARVHSNSWGSAQAGLYTLDSANTDDFVWDNPDMLITFSAGNEGIDANANGVVDNDSIGSPATAKNVITVGASENYRADGWPCDTSLTYTSSDAYQSGRTCSSMSGKNLLGTYGQRWGADYPAEPLFSDLTAGSAEQMASFSSRGPTDDGRIKPDIVAPGTWILSGYSDLYQQGYEGDPVNPRNGIYQWDGWGMPFNADYKYMGGTSMSNPIAAGGAAVVRDYYQKAHGLNASAALVKATLINSAVDLLDENNDGANDNDFPIPNVHEGWGRINLANATDGSHQFVDNGTGIGTGGSASYNYSVSGGGFFKVSLVWSDFASTETASTNLVNDLDLIVTSPGGTVYRGNSFSGGWAISGGSADRINNVENVYVQSAGAGTWTVQVSGFNVPNGPQRFALVVDGGSAGPTPVPPTPTPQPPTPTPVPPTATPEPAGTMHVGDLDGSSTAGSRGKWNAAVTITIHNGNDIPLSGATVSGSWSGGGSGSGSCTTNGSGQCTVSKNNISQNGSSITFTVTNVTHSSNTYSAGANHDPDGDSNGTAITVLKP